MVETCHQISNHLARLLFSATTAQNHHKSRCAEAFKGLLSLGLKAKLSFWKTTPHCDTPHPQSSQTGIVLLKTTKSRLIHPTAERRILGNAAPPMQQHAFHHSIQSIALSYAWLENSYMKHNRKSSLMFLC